MESEKSAMDRIAENGLALANAEGLISASRDIATPFHLQIKDQIGVKTIEVERIFRLLPGRRIVALAKDGGQPVLVKIFLGRSANKYARRERSGIRALQVADVETPEILWGGQFKLGEVVALSFLSDATSLLDYWPLKSADRPLLLNKVVAILARMHAAGVVQNDIHLDNFLISGENIFTIDGGAVERNQTEALSESASLKNLAMFFAQLQPRFDCLVQGALPHYMQQRDMQQRGWPQDESRLDRLMAEISRQRETRKRNYIGKTLRECSRFFCKSSFSQFEVCDRDALSSDMRQLLDSPDEMMASGKILKNGNSATVALVQLGERSVVVKRYNMKSAIHWLRRMFRPSRAWHAWRNAHLMEFLGIASLRPLALIERRIGPLRSTAYLVTDYVEGQDAMSVLPTLDNPNGELKAIVDILGELSSARLSHGDLKATNFLMTADGPVVIDLDGMQEHQSTGSLSKAFRRDLERFMANWQDQPELRQRFEVLLEQLSARHGANV